MHSNNMIHTRTIQMTRTSTFQTVSQVVDEFSQLHLLSVLLDFGFADVYVDAFGNLDHSENA